MPVVLMNPAPQSLLTLRTLPKQLISALLKKRLRVAGCSVGHATPPRF
jgi:hypothetical protein